MWFFLAVVLLWGTTAMLGRQDDWVLPPLVQWGWWTTSLYLCGAAVIGGGSTRLENKVGTLFGFTLVVLYYTTMSGTYLTFLPSDMNNPNLWPTVFLSVNLVGPILLVSVGCMSTTIQRGR